jgi:hypothetical protein
MMAQMDAPSTLKKGHDQNILVILVLLHFQDGTNEMKQYQFFTNCK